MEVVAVIPDPRAARSLRFSPSERTVDGYHPSKVEVDGRCARASRLSTYKGGRR